MNSGCNWEMLNAYIDGELSTHDNAQVANAVALDPELARQVATLSSLKATVATAGCTQEKPINLDFPGNEKTWLPWVASFVVVFVVGAILATLVLSTNLFPPAKGLVFAEQVHLDWLQKNPATAEHGLQLASAHDLSQLRIDAYVPDLSKVNLTFSGIRNISSGKSTGMHIGYQGPHGCRVSLVVLDKPNGLSEELTRFERGQHWLYGWQVRQAAFYLLAYKMDPVRLAEVARVVNKLTRERLPLDPESILALKEARSSSKACLV